MSRLDDLPPDQRATLSLLLSSRKTYAEVAALLNIQERAVHDRAHAALAVLAVRHARALSAERRAEVGDYLLGQRTGVAERLATRSYLQSTPAARAWAAALADELAPLAGDSLAQIPSAVESPGEGDEHARAASAPAPSSKPAPASAPATASTPEPAPGTAAPKRSRPSAASSRKGGAVLLALLIAAVVVAVVLIADSGGGSSSDQATSAAAGATTDTTPASSTGSTAATSTDGAKAKEEKRITLRPPDASSNAAGVAEVLSEGKQYAFYLAAEHLPPSKGKGFFYAVWLYNSPTSHEPLGRSPEVGANGSLQGGALLPANAGSYHTMLLTRETSTRPSKPGPVVLRGAFALH